jgi:endonuclease YncB( thermonuclease family)
MPGMTKLTTIRVAFLALACSGYGSCADGPATQPPPTQSAPSRSSVSAAEARSRAPASTARPVPGGTESVQAGTVTYVFDGDTFKLRLASGEIIVRMHSIDTPEHDQAWGPEAAAALASKIQGRQVSLEVVTRDSYDRYVADVFLGEESVNAWMVQRGDAWAYRHYLQDANYCNWEDEARRARHGLWSLPPGTWRAPWELRAAERGEAVAFTDYGRETVAHCVAAMPAGPAVGNWHVPVAGGSQVKGGAKSTGGSVQAQPRSGNCRIKGNIGSSGRIYHVPGSESYDDTQINESKGERWFCTEEEARAAGWRPAGSSAAAKQ